MVTCQGTACFGSRGDPLGGSRAARNRNHEIRKGEPRFVVREPGPAGGEKGYCAECAAAMLEAAEAEIRALRASLP